MPIVINTDGAYKLPDAVYEESNEKRFDYIFDQGIWARSTKGESVSGSGSTLKNTILYKSHLKTFLKSQNKKRLKFFDAPCGDLNWVKELFDHFDYIGGDISGNLINDLKVKYPESKIFKFDIIKDNFPNADVWHCRHCLMHLSLSDIVMALENFCRSNIDQALITNHFLEDSVTHDIQTGSFRRLDLTNHPFYLPKPISWLLDSHDFLSGKTNMATGVWTKKQIQQGVKNYNKIMKI